MSIALEISGGGSAELEVLEDNRVVLHAPRAAPPGSTVSVRCAAGAFGVKVTGCKRICEGSAGFRIEGRPVNLRRDVRQRLRDCST
jgi:hypothetical protein